MDLKQVMVAIVWEASYTAMIEERGVQMSRRNFVAATRRLIREMDRRKVN